MGNHFVHFPQEPDVHASVFFQAKDPVYSTHNKKQISEPQFVVKGFLPDSLQKQRK